MGEPGVMVRAGPWTHSGPPVTVECRWFAARTMVSRDLAENLAVWSEAQLVARSKMQRAIQLTMRQSGYVPVGEAEVEQIEDLSLWVVEWRLKQRGMEDQSAVWVAIRQALDEDQAWFSNPFADPVDR